MSGVPELGELIANRYRIQALAREGPGYLTLHAFDRDVEVEVSLLWFRAGLFPTEEARREFLGDAVTIRGLAHPHLRRVYEAHVHQGSAFATAQVGSAAAVVKRLGSQRPADEFDVIRYATAIGEGLEAAHRLGQIHGYFVPSDVIEVSGQIKVSSVGLYRAASRDVARDLFWTRRRYLAPEVLAGEKPTVRSDVFSVAAVLAEIASGVSLGEITPAREAASKAHPRIRDVLSQALDSSPRERHASVGAVLQQLRRQLVDDRVPTAKQPAMQAPLLVPDTKKEVVIEAEEPPLQPGKRPTTKAPKLTKDLLADAGFDPSPISLLHADGDPMALPTDEDDEAIERARERLRAGSSSPWSRIAADELSERIKMGEYSDVGDKTVEIDFGSKTREYRLSDGLPPEARRPEPALILDEPLVEFAPSSAPIAVGRDDTPTPAPLPKQPAASMAASTPRPEALSSPLPPVSAEIAAPPDPFSAPIESAAKSRSSPSLEVEIDFAADSHRPSANPGGEPVTAPALDPSPKTLRAMPPPPAPPAPAQAPVFRSEKPPAPSAPPTPIIPPLERPGADPVLRPMAPVPSAPASLGNYPAPRSDVPPPAAPKSSIAIWLWAAAAVVAIVLGGLLAVIFVRSSQKSHTPPPDAAVVAVAPAIDAAPPIDAFAGPCKPPMLFAEPENEVAFCIDKFEATAANGTPATDVLFADAEAACAARGARLCTSAEWNAACRGPEGASYPYGRRFVRDACNASFSSRGQVERGGNFPECESAVGAFDMSGNVAEWTAEGFVQGGSAVDSSGGRCSRRFRGRPTKAYRDVGYRCCADSLAQDPPSR